MKFWSRLVCILIGHNPYSHSDAADFLEGKQTICPRCGQVRFPCDPIQRRSPFETLSHAEPTPTRRHYGDCYAGNCDQCKEAGEA